MAGADLFADAPDAPAKSVSTTRAARRAPDLFADAPAAPSAADLIATGVKKLPSSVGDLVKNTISSLNPANYPAEGRAISSLVRGGLENVRDISPPGPARGPAPPMATPQEQAAATAAGHQMTRPFVHPLKAFSEDPAGALSTWSIPLTAGGSALEATPVGALQATGKAMRVAGDVTNPVGFAVKGAGVIPKVVAKVTPKQSPAVVAKLANFDAAGVDPSFATTGGPLTRGAADFTAKGPFSVGARANLAGQVGQVGDAAETLAAKYGTARPPNLAGETIQEGVKGYVGDVTQPTSFKAKVEKLYDAAFDPIAKGEADAVAQAEADNAAKAGALKAQHAQAVDDAKEMQRGEQLAADQGMPVPEDQKTVLPEAPELPKPEATTATPETQKTLSEIAATINSPSLRKIIQDARIPDLLDAIQKDPSAIRFNDLRALRTWVRSAQGNPDLILGVGQGNLQRLEGALTSDIYTNAEKFGGDSALRKLQRTDDYYRKGVERIQTALQPFVDKSSGEGAFARIQTIAGSGSTADVNSLFRLRRSVPEDQWGDIQASVIQNAGQVSEGGTKSFSPTAFVKWYSGLPDKSKDILFGATGASSGAKAAQAGLRKQLDNLVSVAADVAPVEKTSQAIKGASPWQAGSLGLTALGALSTGHPMVLLGEIGALTGEAGVAQFLTSPNAVRWMNRVSAAAKAGGDKLQPVLNGLSRAAKTDAQLQPLYQAADKVLHPDAHKDASPQDGAGDPRLIDPSKMTEEELRALAGPSAPPEPGVSHGANDAERVSMINSLKPEEAMALTMAGEGSSDPHELAGIGHVIQNRMQSGKYGSSMTDLLTPAEFNVWENPEALMKLKGTPKYEAALALARQITEGKHADITNGAHSYYAPKALAELHKTQPEKYPHERPQFAKGDGLPLGESVFYP